MLFIRVMSDAELKVCLMLCYCIRVTVLRHVTVSLHLNVVFLFKLPQTDKIFVAVCSYMQLGYIVAFKKCMQKQTTTTKKKTTVA